MMKLAVASALLALAAAPAETSRAARPIGDVAQWFGPEMYPPAALRAGEQGRVAVRLVLDAAGRPTGCEVATSSGSAVLDSSTCEIAITHLRFTPAIDGEGQPIASRYPLAIRWVLPRELDEDPVPVAFAGSGDSVTCTATIGGVARRLKTEACRSLAKAIVADGRRPDQVQIVPVPPEVLESETPQ